MAKLTHEKLVEEITQKPFTLVDDSRYANMNSPIVVRCNQHGHLIETTLKDFRHPSFECPSCGKQIITRNIAEIPPKIKGTRRIIACDQATEKFGLSVFDNGKLVFYHLFTFTGDVSTRIAKIWDFMNEFVLTKWSPDYLIFEDIQYQNGILTYKVLAQLLGIMQTSAIKNNVPFECVSPNVWRKYAGTCGKTRREEKLLSIAKVREKFGIIVNDDIAEAILIGNYGVRMHGTNGFGVLR